MTPVRQRICAALFGVCLTLCAAGAQAEEAPDASLKSPAWLAPKSSARPSKAVASGPSVGLGRSLGVLLVASVLGGSALYLRSRKHKTPQARLAQLRVVGSTKLGGRAQLVLAEVNGRKILLGVTDNSVRKLGWMDAEQAEEEELPAGRASALGGRGCGSRRSFAAHAGRTRAGSGQALLSGSTGVRRGEPRSPPDDDSAALILAAETQDTFTRGAPRTGEPRRPEAARKNGNPQMIDLEGQAKGLLARLGEPRP